MHGLVYEIFEEWVLEQQGIKAWHAIKEKAGCNVQDQAFVTRTFYSYDSWVDLITAAADVLNSTFDAILEAYGHYNIRYHFSHGYDALLKCQGSTLRQWLSNLNAMHDHIQKSFPGGNFCPPVFWCEDSDVYEGSILLHYYSQRGKRLVPWVVGIVKELASYHFGVDIDMHRLSLQNVDGSNFTTWRIVAVDPTQTWKLSPKISHHVQNDEVNFNDVPLPAKCPFSGRKLKQKSIDSEASCESTAKCPFSQDQDSKSSISEHFEDSEAQMGKCPFSHNANKKDSTDTTVETATSSMTSSEEFAGVSYDRMKDIFPFHVLVNQDFHVVQVGSKLPQLLKIRASEMRGSHINKFLEITRPVLGTSWNWSDMKKLADQNFILSPSAANKPTERKVAMSSDRIKFKASMLETSHDMVMFVLSPEVNNVTELNKMGLTLSDLPLQSNQRDAVFLGEYVTQEADKAHKLDKLSRTLDEEKNLSNTLLYSIIPHKVADDLRRGKTVDPVFHENVTLFFSDIVGFTKICDQVEAWDVIDMMNQLYSIMDFLAEHFKLFKVETVGDAYMCCSGLPEPDEFHAENVTNFALAVVECAKHVKSPVDGTPVKMRIGIHTGSCTSGVVGTLTPHYCLFGDMVNTTARHESTGVPGKIHCSSHLFSRLKHFAKLDEPQYNFKARGLVDMKGKGQNYTYFVESGTEFNQGANSEALAELSERAQQMIASKAWKKRKYFRKGGLVDAASVAGYSTSSQSGNSSSARDEESSRDHSIITNLSQDLSGEPEGDSIGSNDSILADDIEEDEVEIEEHASCDTIIDLSEEQQLHFGKRWENIKWDESLSFEESLERITNVLSSCLKQCVHKDDTRMHAIDAELQGFVKRIAGLYKQSNPYHNFDNTTQAFTRAVYLWETWATARIEENKFFENDPWDRFALLFCVLIHGAGHEGVPNSQLEAEKHLHFQLNRGKGSYQQRYAFNTAFEILEEDFGELYDEIIFGCPSFRGTMRKLMLATDVETEDALLTVVQDYDRLNEKKVVDARGLKELNQAKLCLLASTAIIGHYTQSYEIFIQRNRLQFEEILKAFRDGRAEDPRDSWYYEQNMYFQDAVLPLIARIQHAFPSLDYVQNIVESNIVLWGDNGREWVAASRLPGASVRIKDNQSRSRMESLVNANVDILETLLRDVAACHGNSIPFDSSLSRKFIRTGNPVDEIKLAIEMKRVNMGPNTSQTSPELSPAVRADLRHFVVTIASGYQSNEFHNFMHASHVTHLANLLLTGIHAKEGSKDASGIAYDPLAKFAIVLSALIHDVGHTGIPNRQLADENPGLAERYNNKSIAEQNSIDTAWEILMSNDYRNLHQVLFDSHEEKLRLRHLLVNCVMATDIFDKDLRETRQLRWEKVFSDTASSDSNEDESNTKATIVIEHIMQASDVAHTMQKWEIYREWNENLFNEFYDSYRDGRTPKDPSTNWYNGELWFFDNWVIPLAENLRECGVLDIVSNQLIKQAKSNRKQWEIEGTAITEEMTRKAVARNMRRSASRTSYDSLASFGSVNTTGTEAILTSQIVSEVETLSKVVKRYERKMEAACGNLIALAYKGTPVSKELKNQSWDKIHNHFKQLDWYRMYSDDDFSQGGSEMSSRDPAGWGSRRVQILVDDLAEGLARAENIVKGEA